MALEIYTVAEAPSFARHSSSFKSDERCTDVHYVVGDSYNEVLVETIELYTKHKLTDYDINYSTEGAAWVGVTCVDV